MSANNIIKNNRDYIFKGEWVTSTVYSLRNTIFYQPDGSGYVCLIPHTSGTFATDLAAGKWEKYHQGFDPDAIETLTNKTIDGDDNTLQDIAYSSIKSTSRTGSDTKLVTGTAGSDGDVAFWNADGDVIGGKGSGVLKGIIVYTTGTAQTYTPSTGVKKARVTVVGPGGGGGGADGGSSQAGCGGGGSAGGWAIKLITSLAASYTYTIGNIGTGGSAGNNAGNDATDTTFTDGVGLTLTGSHGWGGGSMAAGTGVAFASAAGAVAGTGGDINGASSAGGLGLRLSGTVAGSGFGGSSPLGGGGQGRYTSGVGLAGSGYGAGGSGAMADTTTDRAGGNGSGGLIIIEEYY